MKFALALFTLVTYVDAISNIPRCPTGCNCQETSSSLTIDCRGLPAVHVKQLSNELDAILSSDHRVEHLASLRITNTPLTHVPASVCKLVHLTSLNLNHNYFAKLSDNCFTKLTKLVTLSVSRNAIVGLQDGAFDGLQSLVSLDLSYNQIAFIGLRVFSNSSDLIKLRSLNLDGNKLSSLEPWWYYRCILGNKTSPVRISLSHNLISNFTNKLQFEYRCGMKIPCGELNLSGNRIRHIMDILSGWNVVHGSNFTALLCLMGFGVSPNMYFNFSGIPYVCDCTDFWFLKFAHMGWMWHMDSVYCIKPVSLLGRSVRRIPLNKFVCELTDRCPSNNCSCVYRPAHASLHVYCAAANLPSLPLDLPPLPKSYVKYRLDFSSNKLIRRLEHRPYFANTYYLDVNNCGIIEIDPGVLKDMNRLGNTNLRGNMLQTFPRQAETVNISARLLIGLNPYRCSCGNSWMIGWLQSLSEQIADQRDITCASPPRMCGRNVLKSTVKDFCADREKRVLIILILVVSLVACVFLLLIIWGILIYKRRVKFFRRWKFHPFDRDECVGEDMDYDVFLCCSSEDHSPHGLRILREMESNGYRVCCHHRNTLAGTPITDNMIQSIKRSKRTVCFVSKNFLRRLSVTLFRYFSLTIFFTSSLISLRHIFCLTLEFCLLPLRHMLLLMLMMMIIIPVTVIIQVQKTISCNFQDQIETRTQYLEDQHKDQCELKCGLKFREIPLCILVRVS